MSAKEIRKEYMAAGYGEEQNGNKIISLNSQGHPGYSNYL